MPEFVLPALRHLEAGKNHRIAVVWNADCTVLLALAVFVAVSPSWKFPFPKLVASRSKHSFQSGILVREGYDPALKYLLNQIIHESWCAIEFGELREDSLLYQQLKDAAQQLKLVWILHRRYQRAMLIVRQGERWRGYLSRHRHRRMNSNRKRLAELGKVETRISFGEDISAQAIQRFIYLESLGWKADTSLAAAQQELCFFQELVSDCRSSNMIFLCELIAAGETIAATVNFCVDGLGFAFKVGVDPAFAKYSPGYLVEYGFLEAMEHTDFPFREVESGAQSGSYIEALWPDRINIVSGEFVVGVLPVLFSRFKQKLKPMYQRLRS